MKHIKVLLILLVCLFAVTNVFAQAENFVLKEITYKGDGSEITLLGSSETRSYRVSPWEHLQGGKAEEDAAWLFVSAAENGTIAALSKDWETAACVSAAGSGPVEIEPGFRILSASLSPDGSLFILNSSDEIRAVVYNAETGEKAYDLEGFETAAPVYDASLSRDDRYVIWHSRGTFAVQDLEDGSFGEKISLWDFASSWELSPDSSALAVGIINDDYEKGAVIFFDSRTGKEMGRTLLGSFAPFTVKYSADGSMLMAADADTVYAIDPRTFEIRSSGKIPETDPEDRISCAAVSPDGRSGFVQINNERWLTLFSMDDPSEVQFSERFEIK